MHEVGVLYGHDRSLYTSQRKKKTDEVEFSLKQENLAAQNKPSIWYSRNATFLAVGAIHPVVLKTFDVLTIWHFSFTPICSVVYIHLLLRGNLEQHI